MTAGKSYGVFAICIQCFRQAAAMPPQLCQTNGQKGLEVGGNGLKWTTCGVRKNGFFGGEKNVHQAFVFCGRLSLNQNDKW